MDKPQFAKPTLEIAKATLAELLFKTVASGQLVLNSKVCLDFLLEKAEQAEILSEKVKELETLLKAAEVK
jgi:hypothetical protein